ncbi:HIT family protein [Cohnella sp. JJ-181]|uniref:HIT family protein n=1 Tax=Cohnella rhizoplanae TaxID=2974897 RepID=UPI00232C95B5|nr:HIT family protein [Cohnella sp. JJ-181]
MKNSMKACDRVECLGCRIANQLETEVNLIYETERIACVLDIAPFNDGHLLILPKQHYLDIDEIENDLRHEIIDTSVKMSLLLKRSFNPHGITICQNGGIFNDLRHYHMHVIPRYDGDDFRWSEPKLEFKTDRTLEEVRNLLIAAHKEE